MGNIIGWIIIGLIAGWLASKVMGKGGYGIIGDIIIGLVGAVVGGFVASLLKIGTGLNPNDPISWGSLALAFVGAIILIFVLRAVSGKRSMFGR
jgi:uncharacterized membrane protein YeaQ/YmgE (transglycosylase-associated protein family)